ncbi:unnamed protein product [Pedinophyceae sp. YPF-701]|nr:unnamed protein product [Pedinophyceae sp. YPF-701]
MSGVGSVSAHGADNGRPQGATRTGPAPISFLLRGSMNGQRASSGGQERASECEPSQFKLLKTASTDEPGYYALARNGSVPGPFGLRGARGTLHHNHIDALRVGTAAASLLAALFLPGDGTRALVPIKLSLALTVVLVCLWCIEGASTTQSEPKGQAPLVRHTASGRESEPTTPSGTGTTTGSPAFLTLANRILHGRSPIYDTGLGLLLTATHAVHVGGRQRWLAESGLPPLLALQVARKALFPALAHCTAFLLALRGILALLRTSGLARPQLRTRGAGWQVPAGGRLLIGAASTLAACAAVVPLSHLSGSWIPSATAVLVVRGFSIAVPIMIGALAQTITPQPTEGQSGPAAVFGGLQYSGRYLAMPCAPGEAVGLLRASFSGCPPERGMSRVTAPEEKLSSLRSILKADASSVSRGGLVPTHSDEEDATRPGAGGAADSVRASISSASGLPVRASPAQSRFSQQEQRKVSRMEDLTRHKSTDGGYPDAFLGGNLPSVRDDEDDEAIDTQKSSSQRGRPSRLAEPSFAEGCDDEDAKQAPSPHSPHSPAPASPTVPVPSSRVASRGEGEWSAVAPLASEQAGGTLTHAAGSMPRHGPLRRVSRGASISILPIVAGSSPRAVQDPFSRGALQSILMPSDSNIIRKLRQSRLMSYVSNESGDAWISQYSSSVIRAESRDMSACSPGSTPISGPPSTPKASLLDSLGRYRSSLQQTLARSVTGSPSGSSAALEWSAGDEASLESMEWATLTAPVAKLKAGVVRMFDKLCLFDEGLVTPDCLRVFLDGLQSKYLDNPYHNFRHAIDVTHRLFLFLFHSPSALELVPTVDRLAAMVAALGHDLGHLGVSNQYLVQTGHELALRYNDRSVQEQHHLYLLFSLLNHGPARLLEALQPDTKVYVRALIIHLVLHTDMSEHFDLLARFEALSANLARSSQGEGSRGSDGEGPVVDRNTFLAGLMHAADIGHTLKPWHSAERWARLVNEEFWRQGDLQRDKSLPVTPMFDRAQASTETQLSFLEVIVAPLLTVVFKTLPELESLTAHMLPNYEKWVNLYKEEILFRGGVTRPATGGGGAGVHAAVPANLPAPIAEKLRELEGRRAAFESVCEQMKPSDALELRMSVVSDGSEVGSDGAVVHEE